MWRYLRAGLVCFACVCFGGISGWLLSGAYGERAFDRAVAMSWGDGKYGKDFYGAQVYLIPVGGGYSVRARVLIGPGNGYYHDCGEIGQANTIQDAIDRFSKISWGKNGLTIGGSATVGFHLPRSRLESHR